MIVKSKIRRLTARVLIVVLTWAVLFLVVDKVLMPQYTRKYDEFSVPKVVGLPMYKAMAAAEQCGFEVVRERARPDAKQLPETVVEQRPVAGSKAKQGRIIFVTVASKIAQVIVPDVYELSQREAAFKLEEAGLTVDSIASESEYSDLVLPGFIDRQEPAAGTPVKTASKVNIFLSRGPSPGKLLVPDVSGIAIGFAIRQLKKAGFRISDPVYERNLEVPEGSVIRQNPVPGTVTEPGTSVELVVSTGSSEDWLRTVKQ